MELNEALVVWAQEKRRRDIGQPFDRERVVQALHTMFRSVLEVGEPTDPTLPQDLAVGLTGTYNVESATDDEILQLAEDMYQDSRGSSSD